MTETTPKASPSGDGRDRPNENRTTHDQSTTTEATTSSSGAAEPSVEPQLPHDIDESAHSQARASASQESVGRKAYEDTVSPSRDTDRGPLADELYNDRIAPDRGSTPPRR